MIIPEGFTELLTFLSVRGNQEERILMITETMIHYGKNWLLCRKRLKSRYAEIIHGHQWEWGGEPWALINAEVKNPLSFTVIAILLDCPEMV